MPDDYRVFCTCFFPTRPYLTLRGLCKKSNIDRMYLPQNHPIHGDLTIYGLMDTTIEIVDNKWMLSVIPSNNTGFSKAKKKSFALGKFNWTIYNDNTNCNEGQPYTTELKLTGCQEDEFTCSDGQCVRMVERCDQLVDCRDESDESDCNLLVLKKSYNKKVPPITATSSTNFTIVPVPVNISIILMKIVSLEEVSHIIQLQFGIVLKWRENRAIYHNLKK